MFVTVLTDVIEASDTESVEEAAQEVAEYLDEIKDFFVAHIANVIGVVLQVLFAILILIVGLRIIKRLTEIGKRAMQKSKLEAGVVSFLSSLLKYALYFVLILLILAQFGVTTGSVVAVLGSAGLTIGLALQGSLANFAGGVLILLLKPFVVGDYIVSEAGGQEGTVESISICYTKLLTIDNKVIQIPNGALSNATIINVSQMPKRMIELVIGVSYESNLDKVKSVLNKVAEEEAAVLEGEPVVIYVSELAESSIDMGFRVWVKTEDYWQVKWRLTENVKKAFDENGISIPFPQLDVQLKNIPKDTLEN